MIKVTTKKLSPSNYQAEGVGQYDLSAAMLWSRAGSPNLLAPDCLNLRFFTTPENLVVGNPIKETHVFAGIPQLYEGQICQYDEGKSWAMGTHPTTLRWLFGLPHFVEYSFADNMMKISVKYVTEGVASWPLIRSLVQLRMKKAVTKLLIVVA